MEEGLLVLLPLEGMAESVQELLKDGEGIREQVVDLENRGDAGTSRPLAYSTGSPLLVFLGMAASAELGHGHYLPRSPSYA